MTLGPGLVGAALGDCPSFIGVTAGVTQSPGGWMSQFPGVSPPALLVCTDQTLPLETKYFLPQGGAGALPSLSLQAWEEGAWEKPWNDPEPHGLSLQTSGTL